MQSESRFIYHWIEIASPEKKNVWEAFQGPPYSLNSSSSILYLEGEENRSTKKLFFEVVQFRIFSFNLWLNPTLCSVLTINISYKQFSDSLLFWSTLFKMLDVRYLNGRQRSPFVLWKILQTKFTKDANKVYFKNSIVWIVTAELASLNHVTYRYICSTHQYPWNSGNKNVQLICWGKKKGCK